MIIVEHEQGQLSCGDDAGASAGDGPIGDAGSR